MERPFVWQMIKEAVDNLNGRATYLEIRKYVNTKWGNVNESTINAQIIVLCVNHASRIHYPENKKPRLSNSQYDILFSTGRGQVVKYNPQEHGTWEIFQNEFGGLGIRQIINDLEDFDEQVESGPGSFLFPIEANLRDFLIRNLHTYKEAKLKLFVDENGRDGREYPTDVGPIDILTVDEVGNFVVFELKLSRGADRALGQLLRYMGWVKKNLAKNKDVKGVIVANEMDEKIKYAVTVTTNISLFEYEMKFELFSPKD
ncbi:MAG: endonuclease NucS [Bacteroidia bacterium]|nr:endonuclease NucS [Bacteroidia bacterium]